MTRRPLLCTRFQTCRQIFVAVEKMQILFLSKHGGRSYKVNGSFYANVRSIYSTRVGPSVVRTRTLC